MKRIVLIASVILLGLTLRAQSVTYTCRYWFDQNDAQAVTTAFNGDIWQAELDVGTLTEGLHTLHVQAADTSSAWCSPLSYMFLKLSPTESLLDPVDMSNLTYRCWFDQDHAHQQIGALGNGGFLFDVEGLDKGLHTIHVMLEGSAFTSSQSYMFFKFSDSEPLLDSVDMSNLTYLYWFDQDHAHQQIGALGNGVFLFDVEGLDKGLHTIHVMLEGSAFTSSQSYMFFKFSDSEPLLDSVDMSNLTYLYWFDQDHAHQQTGALGNGVFLFDVSELEEGLHSVNILLEGSTLTSTQSYMFVKVTQQEHLIDPIDMSHLAYHCWYDQDYENHVIDSVSNGIIQLDLDNIADGLHTVHIMLEGEALTSILSYVFVKVSQQNSLIEPIDMSNLVYHCWFDQDYENNVVAPMSNGILLLDVDNVSDGLHSVHILLEGEAMTSTLTYMFMKKPQQEDFGIAKWQYYLNGDVSQIHTTEISPVVDTLDIITLLPVETWPVRSSCFHFHPNGDEPYLNAKNEVIFRFWTNDDRVLEKSAFYVDYQVQQNITAEVFERNTTETFTAPRNNQIQWFKVEANIGDSLAFVADKACTMQLFAPSGEEVYAATASEAMELGGCHVWEDGMYYLAVHDVTGSGETISVTYQYVHKYAVFAHDVHQVGNGGNSTITFQGNGFNSLLDAYLVNAQNDTIRPLNIGHESNSTTTVTFNFNGVNLGMYDVVFQFVNEVIQIQNAIQVEEATPFTFDASVTFANRFLRTTSNKYVFQVHNNSNMTAYNVPLLVHVYTPDAESLTRVDIGGFDVKSDLIRLLGSHYSDSLDIVIEQKRLTSGDLFDFLEEPNTEYVPDAPYLHYTIISPDLRPNTTETFTISVQSTNTVSVYMWCPEEWENEVTTRNLSKPNLRCDMDSENRRKCKANKDLEDNGQDPFYTNIDCDNLPPPPPGCPPPPGGPSVPVNSLDPNDIHGYLSESGSHYMRQEIQNVQYEIEFENDTTLATAAAHTIIVRDTLDATKFDLNSLAARSVTIGDKRLELNGEQTFARTLDMRPELYVIAQIEQDYDPTTGIVEWTIQSLDPMTMEPTDDPNQGVLPVNYYGNGVGFIDYSINVKQAFADGTSISNRAGIIFDQNDVIMTPTWTNTVDAVKPTSYIEEVTTMADSLNFVFVSQDNRSGVWYHSLYYRNVSTEQEWQVRKAQIFEDSFVLHLEDLLTTEYLVIAVDSAGNREDKDMVAEYIYTASGLHFVTEGNWSITSNWQEGSLPGSDDMVFIDAPCQLDQDAEVAALAINNCHTLTVQSGKTLTVNGLLSNTSAEGLVIEDGAQLVNASANVAATVKKDVQAYNNGDAEGWYTIASPMNGMAVAGSGFVTPEYDLYRYNETNLNGEEWENYKANLADFTTFEKGRGYLFANSNSFSPVFIGTLNSTDVTCSLTYTNRPNDPLSGFNLIGNPFPHNIYKGAGAAIDNANLASGYYTLTNEGTWQAHTFEDAILPGQGILVKATAPTVLTIVKSNLAATSESSEAERSKGSLSISIAGDNGQDQAYVYFGQGIGLDKVKSIALDAPSLAVRNGNGDFAIAHCDKKSDAVELVFTTPDEGSFTMDVNVVAGDFDYLHLIDSLTGDDVDLLATPIYTFKASARDDASRFRLVFSIKGN